LKEANVPKVSNINQKPSLYEIEVELRPETKFCTGSHYIGEWNKFGMCGKGMYYLPNGEWTFKSEIILYYIYNYLRSYLSWKFC